MSRSLLATWKNREATVAPREGVTRRVLLGRLAAAAVGAIGASVGSGRAWAFGPQTHLDIPLLQYDSPSWNPRPTALRRLLLEVEMTTSVLVVDQPSTVTPDEDSLFEQPLVVWAGADAFAPLSQLQRDALGLWLRAGGTLLVDGHDDDPAGPFAQSVERELAAILPGQPLAPIPTEHVLWRTFYLINGPLGRRVVRDPLDGVFFDGRLAVIRSHNDLLGAMARDGVGNYQFDVTPGGSTQREMTQRFGVNVVMYALCLDYKDDQVHVPFLLRRRRWRVD